ncbi:transglutaminase family protein [Dyadobacter fanqingshengii]|uniref:Transglutaminase family protein n=1 Tax=Dyadobacter fanqingshengii TaxID=2906443 RepID=A0A9X1P7Z9_9BACT|nr:transglutaminase family protein [Dyadobacter fanqingshengii]MCF0038923.1 transglutaminase family protein [Dyadobacter fanqingshengii]USJ34254.1 transglutaminase family protein [Dyadobacter fanqingshengii]
MNLQVRHSLEYQYNFPVVLEMHTLYLYPRSYPHQRLLEYNMFIDPQPSKIVKNIDVEGNVQHLIYFYNQPYSRLFVEASITVSSEPVNVFDFVFYPFETSKIPFLYDNRIYKYLIPYLDKTDATQQVEQFARQLAAKVDYATIPFLVEMSQYISQNFVYQHREYGNAYPPDETLRDRSGSCREYARLFMGACRSLGIAARFVSGYLYGNPQQAHELHAWVEVFLPGAGWRGFDPTEGKAVINNHISMGTSADYDQLAPVMGSFLGYTSSLLTTHVDIQLLQDK